MAAPQNADLPQFFTLADGMQIVVTAVDPATNATVSGVTISSVSLSVDPGAVIGGVPAAELSGAFLPGEVGA